MTVRRALALLLTIIIVAGASVYFLLGPDRIALTGRAPTPDMPGSVLVIPGHGGSKASVNGIAAALQAGGFTVQVMDIGDGGGDISAYGAQAAQLVKTMREPISLVGYSEGGLIARVAAELIPDTVGRVVTIGTPHEGTNIAALGVQFGSADCDLACTQMVPGSDFLTGLPVADDGTRWLALYSGSDEVVRPVESAALNGATSVDVAVMCSTQYGHSQIVAAPSVARLAAEFIKTGATPEQCPAT